MKYADFSKSEFPSYAQDLSWLGCDLMIQGLQRAGQDPSRASLVKALRGIKAYNGNGLLPITINYSTVFGHDLPQCAWVHAGPEVRLRSGLGEAILWDGLHGYEYPYQLVGCN